MSLCYQTHDNMVMMAEGAGSNICSQPYPKFRDWKVR